MSRFRFTTSNSGSLMIEIREIYVISKNSSKSKKESRIYELCVLVNGNNNKHQSIMDFNYLTVKNKYCVAFTAFPFLLFYSSAIRLTDTLFNKDPRLRTYID
jgi:hypothetical protein